MFLFLIFNTLVLFPLHEFVLSRLSFYHLSVQTLQVAHFALVLSNFFLAFTFNKQKAFEYLGQVNMLAYVVWAALFSVPPLLGLSLLLEGPAAIASGIARASWITWAAVLWQSVGNTMFGCVVGRCARRHLLLLGFCWHTDT